MTARNERGPVGEDQPQDASPENALARLADRHAAGYRSVGTMAYDILRDAILEGALPPGHKLRQETLADQIGVSRLPVRSALIQLEADGLVEFHERRGAVVRSVSVQQAREVYHLRLLLETDALRQAMTDLSADRLARLRSLGQAADEEHEGTEFVDARSRFYAELYNAADYPVRWELIEQLRLKVGRYVLGRRLVGDEEHAHSHAELVDAVASGNVDVAVGLLGRHLESVRDGVLQMLEVETVQSPPPARRKRA